MGMKTYALFLDFPQVSQGKHLKSAGIRQNRMTPGREPVQAAELPDYFISCPHMQVICVAQHHLCVYVFQIFRGKAAFNRAGSRYIHENGGLDHAVHGRYSGALGHSLGSQ